MRLLGHVFAALLLLAMSALSKAEAAKRIAFVVGIDAYQSLPKLKKAVGDARAVGAILRDDLGFTLLGGEDLTRAQMARKLAELDGTISPGDTVLFFFSGHGVALSGTENILLPADIVSPEPGQEGLIRDDGFSVDAIIRRVQSRGAAVTFMVLDACRDNPFEQLGVRAVGSTRGLARVEAPKGVFVLFSAGLGQRALDRMPGDDPIPTSVFTRHFIRALQAPGLSHVQVAKRVQLDVDAQARLAKHDQQPAYYDQILGDIILRARLPNSTDATSSDEENARLRSENERLQREREQSAVLQPAPLPATSVASNDAVLARDLQVELRRLGCLTTDPNGTWGEQSRAAYTEFRRRIARAPYEPTREAIAVARAETSLVCPPACRANQVLVDNRCVARVPEKTVSRDDPRDAPPRRADPDLVQPKQAVPRASTVVRGNTAVGSGGTCPPAYQLPVGQSCVDAGGRTCTSAAGKRRCTGEP